MQNLRKFRNTRIFLFLSTLSITRDTFVLTANGEYSDLLCELGLEKNSAPIFPPSRFRSGIMEKININYGDEFAEEFHLYSSLNLKKSGTVSLLSSKVILSF